MRLRKQITLVPQYTSSIPAFQDAINTVLGELVDPEASVEIVIRGNLESMAVITATMPIMNDETIPIVPADVAHVSPGRAKVNFRGVRTGNAALFEKSGLFDGQENVHHPFLVCERHPGSVDIFPVFSTKALVMLPRDTLAMAQWPGLRRSDWFWFLVQDYLDWKEDHG